jgi:DNA-binding response OmpR family regulator
MSATRIRAKVLFVQADPGLQKSLTGQLEKEGFRVLAARTGEDGIDLARRERPDIAVVDPALPGMLGLIKAIIRQKAEAADDAAIAAREFEGLTIRADAHEVLVDGRLIGFTKTEFDILSLLAGKPNQVFTRSRILDHVREDNYSITERVVDYQVAGIRKKLGKARGFVQTVRGVGYKFRSEIEP